MALETRVALAGTICMRRLTQSDFHARFPRRDPDERFSDRVETLVADLIVTSGANVVVAGMVERSLRVDRGAVVYVDGLVDGTATVSGALCIDSGHVARTLRGSGVVFDPTEPADSEVG